MSLQKYASPLSINILPSRYLLTAMLLMHTGALVLVILISLPWAVQLLFSLFVVASFFILAFRFGWIASWSAVSRFMIAGKAIRWDENDQWWLLSQDNREYHAELLPTSYVHHIMVIVNLRLTGQPWYKRRVSVVFLPDNIEAETFRRLRIRLRWYSIQVPDNSAALK